MVDLSADDSLASSHLFDSEPVAPHVGPFPKTPWLDVWRRHFPSGDLAIISSDDTLIPLILENNTVTFAGHADVTDYHAPLGPHVVEVLGAWIRDLPDGTRLVFDSLPLEAATVVRKAVERASIEPTERVHEVAAVMTLGDSRHDWLAALSKKQRHEVRRKRRRFEEHFGEPTLSTVTGRDSVATFAAMHRKAFGDKGTFMTDTMEAFFADLHKYSGATMSALRAASGDIAAMAFGFFEADGYYLYNSALEPTFAEGAPGVVLLDLLIEQVIDSGLHRFDFLKGDEVYKFRMGATARDLFVIEATT
ncbi:hypothetical protein BMS3Bbin02_01210 [bacterium BMS3Bbin02]|nr:hypothetical protein BMS3Bbin02_01210 [bacterium BMS3Bbin02]